MNAVRKKTERGKMTKARAGPKNKRQGLSMRDGQLYQVLFKKEKV